MNSDAWKLVLSVGVAGLAFGLLMDGGDGDGSDTVEDSGSKIADRAREDGGGGDDGDGSDADADRLECPECGTTTNRHGEPFTSQHALNGHIRVKHS